MNAIDRLRIELDNYGIEYETDNDLFFDRIKAPSKKNCKISIIQGEYSYGGNDDLLEVWTVEREDEPVGYQTVQQTITKIWEAL